MTFGLLPPGLDETYLNPIRFSSEKSRTQSSNVMVPYLTSCVVLLRLHSPFPLYYHWNSALSHDQKGRCHTRHDQQWPDKWS